MGVSAVVSQTRFGPGRLMAAATIFTGAFLLFEVEPLIAKAILPWFGGSAQVWTTCLLFFQAALLAGYLYAHILNTRVPLRWQWRIHAVLLATSLVFLPIVPADYWKPAGGEDPLWLILGLLASTIGLPFVLLSATSPLVQAWLARRPDANERPPYRLFALSNFGSMLALLSYPVVVEPYLPIRGQAVTWSVLFAGFVVVCSLTAWLHRTGEDAPRAAVTVSPSWGRRVLWFCLAAAPSGLLLALTNYMLQNIAAIPLFWVVPLALYLLSFVFAFANTRWYALPLWYVGFAVAIGMLLIVLSGLAGSSEIALLPVIAWVLLILCYVCHSELSLLRPPPRHLTEYYLILSAGGAAGGLFVAVVAPTLFDAPYELPILVPFTVLVVALAAAQHYCEWVDTIRPVWLALGAMAAFAVTAVIMGNIAYTTVSKSILLARNFYGALRVEEGPLHFDLEAPTRYLMNGNILHGIEFVDPARRRQPLSYYAHESGIGRMLDELAKDGHPLHVGVIGLGVGTLAAYGRPGDDYRFYEINPLVEKIARSHFWHLGANPARQSVVLGDARLSLEREPAQHFDVLVVDAFISDSIPMHLLTKQAFALYWRHLKPGGVLAVHVTNRFVNLGPVVAQAEAGSGKTVRVLSVETDWSRGVASSVWVLVTDRTELFRRPTLWIGRPVQVPPGLHAWTDDYSSIWNVLRL